jgi:predicted aldo/keto reductase-like oxidoreductase
MYQCDDGHDASKRINCGQCELKCLQPVDIINRLKYLMIRSKTG